MKKIVLGIVILGLYVRSGRLRRRSADESGASRGAGGADASRRAPGGQGRRQARGTRRTRRPATPNG